MIRIKFNDKNIMQEVNFKMLSEDAVQLTGKKLKNNTSGFKAFRMNCEFLGDYSDFTQCEETDEGYIFTKDTNTK